MITTVLLVVALIAFCIAIGRPSVPVDLTALGLALATLAFLLRGVV